jgi:hypothetical protein
MYKAGKEPDGATVRSPGVRMARGGKRGRLAEQIGSRKIGDGDSLLRVS